MSDTVPTPYKDPNLNPKASNRKKTLNDITNASKQGLKRPAAPAISPRGTSPVFCELNLPISPSPTFHPQVSWPQCSF